MPKRTAALALLIFATGSLSTSKAEAIRLVCPTDLICNLDLSASVISCHEEFGRITRHQQDLYDAAMTNMHVTASEDLLEWQWRMKMFDAPATVTKSYRLDRRTLQLDEMVTYSDGSDERDYNPIGICNISRRQL